MNIAIDTTSFGHDEVKNKNLVNSTSIFTADLLDGFVKLGLAENFTLIVSEKHEEFFAERFPQFKRVVLKWLPLSLAYKFSKGKIKGSKYIKKFGIYRKIANRNWLLKNEKLFVTPSLYEGFGRTPVEAAMCRVSVISTKETSLFDATMGLVNYVENAKDENELADLILEKITNPDSDGKLSEIAYKLKSEYTPKTVNF